MTAHMLSNEVHAPGHLHEPEMPALFHEGVEKQLGNGPAPVSLEHQLGLLLDEVQGWHAQCHAQILSFELALDPACLGSIDLPTPSAPPRNPHILGLLSSLYLVNELEPLIQASEALLGLWSSGAIAIRLPKLEPELARAWRERRVTLAASERQHLLALAFSPQEFNPAMQALCRSLTALADNAKQRDVREEVGLQYAAQTVLELAAMRLDGALSVASSDLLASLRQATRWLADKGLQSAMGVHSLQDLARACLQRQPELAAGLRHRLERARGGSVVLQWLATNAASGFAVDPADAGLQSVIAAAQVWLLARS